MSAIKTFNGGITAVQGVTASGIPCGIKKDGKKDLALLRFDPPSVAAGVYTSNRVVSPSVLVCKENASTGKKINAVIVNSGNANACTGENGYKNAKEITRLLSNNLGNLDPESILIASTGVIGVPLPMEKIREGIPILAEKLSPEGGKDASEAILTTDLVTKEYALNYECKGTRITMGGMAKGSGMINPDMATMLAFLTTDVSIHPKTLQKTLEEVAHETFNRITVDGETSTNDTVLCLANGLAGNAEIREEGEELTAFKKALRVICLELAKKIVKDGEGATKFIEINVTGAQSEKDAARVAGKVANSLLVKTAFFGKDPNWGRILSAAGSSGAQLDPLESELAFEDITVMKGGMPVETDLSILKKVMDRKEIRVFLKIGKGEGGAVIYTTDLSYDYVKINSEYTS